MFLLRLYGLSWTVLRHVRLSDAFRTAVVSYQYFLLRQYWIVLDSSDRHVTLIDAHRTAVVSYQSL